MKKIKKFISHYKISFPAFTISLLTFVVLSIINKYEPMIDNSTALQWIFILSCCLALLCFMFIFVCSSIKYTRWSIVFGLVGSTITIYYAFDVMMLARSIGRAFGFLAFLVPAILTGYFIGSLAMICFKAIFRCVQK